MTELHFYKKKYSHTHFLIFPMKHFSTTDSSTLLLIVDKESYGKIPSSVSLVQ